MQAQPQNISNEKKVFSVLAYLPFFCVAIFILKNDDNFVRFHAKQGIVIFGIFLLTFFPLVGYLAFLSFVVLFIIGASKAYKGEQYKIPFLYQISTHIDF